MLDAKTLAVVFIIISSLLSIALAFNIRSRMKYPGTVIWTWGVIAIAVSFLGLAFQHSFPMIIGIVLTNCGVVLGMIFFLIGVDQFYGRKSKGLWYFLPIAACFIVFVIFTYFIYSTKVRIIFMSFVMFLVLGYTTFQILTSLPKENRIQFMFPAFSFGAYSLFCLIRSISSIFIPPVQTVQDTGAMLSATYMMAIVSITVTSLSLLVVTKARFENELLERNAQLKQTNDTKDKLFSIISHDLRGPVGSTAKLLTFLSEKKGAISQEQIDAWIFAMKESADQTYSLLNNLLLWAESQRRLIEFQPEIISLRDIAADSAELMAQTLLDKKIQITNSITGAVEVYADNVTTRTIVRNILSNAIKFSFAESIIEICTAEESGMKGIIIRDHGKGMSAEKKDSLFQIAHTKSTLGTSGEKGSGLGLVITGEFVDLNNGILHIESEPGKGTAFTVLFPVSAAE